MTNHHGSPDTYLDLVRRLPLKAIKTERQHDEATEVVAGLLSRDLDRGAADYLDALIVLVTKYEDENHAVDEDMTPQEALRALMAANGMSQADVGRIIGSESAVSMFLGGTRELSKPAIRKLAARFRLPTSVFL